MVQLSSEEYALVDELLECIAEAMDRLGDADPEYAGKTKIQKLLYLGINEFDLPVTYSWYLAGAVVPDDPATPGDLQSAFDELSSPDKPSVPPQDDATAAPSESEPVLDNISQSISPEAPGKDVFKPDASDEETEPLDPVLFTGGSDNEPEPSDPTTTVSDKRDEVIDFYVQKVPEVWHQNTMRFLQNFYIEHAPPAYRDFYVQSTHLRTRLREAEITVQTIFEGDEPSQSLADIAEAASLDISDLHCTIRASESLSPTFDGFVSGTDIIEDGLMMLAKQDKQSVTQDHLAAVRSMQEFYYYYVWRYPCLVISQKTASGPSAESLRTKHQNRLTTFELELEEEVTRFEAELDEAGLKPDYTDYEVPDDDITETITSISNHYFE